MSVSTIGLDGFPKTRVVLLKQYTYEGFIFYTNYHSEKGKAIEANPHLCLSFFWPSIERQVIIKGIAERVPANTSDGYFESRPLGSRLGAIVSPQSEVIPTREYLEEQLHVLEVQYEGKEVPRPAHWGGYHFWVFFAHFGKGFFHQGGVFGPVFKHDGFLSGYVLLKKPPLLQIGRAHV